MNLDKTSNSQPSKLQRAIERVCRDFEKAWREQPSYRIERILPSIDDIAESLQVDVHQSDVINPLLAELIHVEMDLRFNGRQEFDRFEYYARFPDFVSVIDEAIDRLKKLDSQDLLESPFVVRTRWNIDGEADSEDGGEWVIQEQGTRQLPTELGPFGQITKIGSGGFGVVCSAVDHRSVEALDHERVALKFPRKKVLSNNSLLRAFLDEANRVMPLNHPGIVKTHSVEQIDGYLFIVQQLIDGSDLGKTRNDPRSHYEIAELIATIADALAYANRQGIIHRDLKPTNILLDNQGRPFIADFGMALHESEQLDTPKQRCGTPSYMSPQLAAGLTGHMDGRTDIWSLGVILYELLAGRRPFRGKTEQDIYEQIETLDPKPLREIDDSISKELQRICLKCLAHKMRDRYLTADELAEDLRHWIGRPQTGETVDKAEFVPKGLRSYSAEDSPFFLELLPGPRDRDGIPGSVRFWKARICEPVASENRVPVGVIYGPSGSGKSSFVKAGLVPQVKPTVDAIYVEATLSDTEVRLIKALRRRFPNIPEVIELPEIFAGLAARRWQSSPQKILIVLDQFEQRLSLADNFNHSQLAKALRHCDGQTVQCLLLVRDDFWLGLTRFVDALEMDLLEGQNSQAIDLFDRQHAKQVLIKLGRAYNQLPGEAEELSPEQHKFLDESIDQLAIGHYVICVRLTLFAEMFKSRPWTLAELKSVGGVHGVGEKFLEATFGTDSTSHRLQPQREAVQAVLEVLLPDAGSDIRGAMKSEQDLLEASGYENQPKKFENLLKTLDNELRLITCTDPDAAVAGQLDDNATRDDKPKLDAKYYQLTHDYLVPSIRDWLTAELRKTRRGRATSRLRELASQVMPGQPPKYLPTNWEWLTWQFYLRNQTLTERERVVMRSARRHFISSVGSAAAILLVVTAIVTFLVVNERRNSFANDLVEDLKSNIFQEAPYIVAQFGDYSNRVLPKLRDLYRTESEPEKKRKLLLGLLQFEPDRADNIVSNITRRDCSPSELDASLRILEIYAADYAAIYKDRLEETLTDDAKDPRSRFRAAVSLANLKDAMKGINWQEHAGLLGSALVQEPGTTQAQWIDLLVPVGQSVNKKFTHMFSEAEQLSSAFALAQAMYAFAKPADRSEFFANLLAESNDAQFNSILLVFEQNQNQSRLQEQIVCQELNADDQYAVASRAIALLRLGKQGEFVELLKDIHHPGFRSHAIILANSSRIKFTVLKNLFEKSTSFENPHFRQGLLMALAERVPTLYDDQQLIWLDEQAKERCLKDKHAGCFAAAELIARRRNLDFMALRKQRKEKSNDGILGSVFINSQDQVFSIIEPSPKNNRKNRIAISMTEVSVSDICAWPEFRNRFDIDPLSFQRPHRVLDLAIVYEYCNWLCQQDGIDESEHILPAPNLADFKTVKIDGSKNGYRLMTFEEWLLVCNEQHIGTKLFGQNFSLADHFAWMRDNSRGKTQDVGRLLPNELGLFDLFGNAWEICTQTNSSKTTHLAIGNFVLQRRDILTTRDEYEFKAIAPQTDILLGFRLVRVLPP